MEHSTEHNNTSNDIDQIVTFINQKIEESYLLIKPLLETNPNEKALELLNRIFIYNFFVHPTNGEKCLDLMEKIPFQDILSKRKTILNSAAKATLTTRIKSLCFATAKQRKQTMKALEFLIFREATDLVEILCSCSVEICNLCLTDFTFANMFLGLFITIMEKCKFDPSHLILKQETGWIVVKLLSLPEVNLSMLADSMLSAVSYVERLCISNNTAEGENNLVFLCMQGLKQKLLAAYYEFKEQDSDNAVLDTKDADNNVITDDWEELTILLSLFQILFGEVLDCHNLDNYADDLELFHLFTDIALNQDKLVCMKCSAWHCLQVLKMWNLDLTNPKIPQNYFRDPSIIEYIQSCFSKGESYLQKRSNNDSNGDYDLEIRLTDYIRIILGDCNNLREVQELLPLLYWFDYENDESDAVCCLLDSFIDIMSKLMKSKDLAILEVVDFYSVWQQYHSKVYDTNPGNINILFNAMREKVEPENSSKK